MNVDIRTDAASFYDYNPNMPNDVPFYLGRVPRVPASVLELGCGTGRVTLPLAQHGADVVGLDRSEAMIAICRRKLDEADLASGAAAVQVAEISDFNLNRQFDLIVAPFRVLQNLETDKAVDGVFRSIDRHLTASGACILNTFNPNRTRDAMRREWCSEDENLSWEVPVDGGRIACYDRRRRMDPVTMVLYPELVYRRFEGETLVEEAVLPLVMRCYYPDELVDLITSRGFEVTGRWGGYEGQRYGQGSELVLQFRRSDWAA